MPTLIDISTRVSQNLGSPDSPSVGTINYYLRHHVGQLNTLLNTGYTIDATDGTIEPDLTEEDAAIFQHIYLIHYYDTKARENLGAASYDSVLEVSEGGALVRMVNKNEVSKTYFNLKKQVKEELDQLVTLYRGNRGTPESIIGDDVTDTWYDGVNSVRTTDE